MKVKERLKMKKVKEKDTQDKNDHCSSKAYSMHYAHLVLPYRTVYDTRGRAHARPGPSMHDPVRDLEIVAGVQLREHRLGRWIDPGVSEYLIGRLHQAKYS